LTAISLRLDGGAAPGGHVAVAVVSIGLAAVVDHRVGLGRMVGVALAILAGQVPYLIVAEPLLVGPADYLTPEQPVQVIILVR
jgi:hypothetical protein